MTYYQIDLAYTIDRRPGPEMPISTEADSLLDKTAEAYGGKRISSGPSFGFRNIQYQFDQTPPNDIFDELINAAADIVVVQYLTCCEVTFKFELPSYTTYRESGYKTYPA